MSKAEEKGKEIDNDDDELESLRKKLRNGVEIKDRKYLLTTYPKCFVGSEAVQFMVKNKICTNVDDAVHLGQMMVAASIFKHVTRDHPFKNENLYYRFAEDEPSHGAKEKKKDSNEDWTWSDFITGLSNNSNKVNLQPKLEEFDDKTEIDSHDDDELLPKKTFGIAPMDKYNQKLLDNVHPMKWVPPKPLSKYNLVVIGAGAGGLVSAAGSAGLGGKVAIIESNLFGGDCLNSGCVPSKALLRAAKVAHDVIIKGKEYGIEIDGKININFAKVMERMRKIRAKISSVDACERMTQTYGMDVFLGYAKFVNENAVIIDGKTELKFSRCVIATGGSPSVPPIKGLREVKYLTNHSLWNLTTLPKRLGVIGSGPIGCEMAQSIALFGSKVTILNRSNRILNKEDPDAAKIIKQSMEDCGITFITGIKFENISYCDKNKGLISGINVKIRIKKTDKTEILTFDHLLIATGRKPNVDGMELSKAKVKFNRKTGIVVDDYLRTTNSNIYAVGDCCSRFQFTHMADAMARIAIRNALFFGRSKVSDLIIPWCTYTLPEVAHVGLYENDLISRKIDYNTIKVELKENDRAICDGEDEYDGFIKIFYLKGKDIILGATIVSMNAGDQISEITLAIQGNIGLGLINNVIHPYPTVSEGIRRAGGLYVKTKLTSLNKILLRKILRTRF